MDIKKLLDFKVNAVYARTSILGFVEILRSQGDGFAKPGEESNDLGIREDDDQTQQQTSQTTSNNNRLSTSLLENNHNGANAHVLPPLAPSSIQSRLQNSNHSSSSPPRHIPEYTVVHPPFVQGQPQQLQHAQAEFSDGPAPHAYRLLDNEQPQSFDVCHPFFDPAMLDLFPDGELPDLAPFETIPMSLYDVGLEAWNMSSTAGSDTRSAI